MSLKLILNKLTSMVLVICMLLSLAAPAVGEEPLTQPTEETVYSDGSTVYADGTVVYADGTIVYADGTTVHADGTTVNADGTTIYPDGTTVYPDGKMVYADGTTVYPDGTTVYADGTVVYANGTIVYADGTTVHADGTTVNTDGTTVYPDGTTVYADGTMVYVNGTVAYPDGTVVYPDGTTLNVDGTTVYSDGTTVYADGTTVYADGTTVYTDGTTVYPERTTVYSDGTTVYPDGTTVYPDGTTNSVLEEEQVPLAAPELYAADPVIETEGDNSEENTAVVTENPVTTGQKTVDPLTTTDPASETQPVTDGEAAGGEAKTPPVIPGKEAELAEEAENAEKSENTESQESTVPAEPVESEPEEEPEENIEGQTDGNPEETAEDPAEDTENTTEETTEDTTEDTAEDTAEDKPEETTENPAAPAEELPLRTLTVSAGQMAFRDQYLNPTEPVLWSGSVWNWLYGSAIEPLYTDGRVTVEISGHLPETVTARAMFIEFVDPSAARNDERALMLLDVTLLDEGGAVYVPTEKLHVSVSAGTISGAAESGEPLAAYFDDSYDGIGAAGDIKVRLDENIDGSRLAYVPEQNEALRFWEAGGRLVSTGNGTVEFDENRFPFRFVLSAQQEAREEEQAETEQENVVKDVMLSGTLVASDGYTYEVSVSYPANCGIPVGAQLSVEELILGSDAYWDYINQSAAELGVSPADLSLARAFDISFVDPETGEHYQPTQDVQVSITLISTPVNAEEELAVLHFDDEAGQVQAMDVALNGEAIEFETGSFSVFVVLQKDSRQNLVTAAGIDDGNGEETENESSVVTAPTAIENLVYNGKALELVTAGVAEGGTLLYALGENGETAPVDVEGEASKWSEIAPTAVDAGPYYVWYKAGAEAAAECVEASIAQKPLTITADSAEKAFDINNLIKDTYTVTGETANDDRIESVKVTGSQHFIGSSDNVPSAAVIKNAVGEDVTANYDITYVNGTLTVTWPEQNMIAKELTAFNGNLATYQITVNPEGYVLTDDGRTYILRDTFSENQSINYGSVNIVSSGEAVTYDFSGQTGTYMIPDGSRVTITYTTRVSGQAGDEATISNTAVVGSLEGSAFIPGPSVSVTETKTISPTGTDISGTGGVYSIKLFAYADGHMERGLGGAAFRLLDSNMRPLYYLAGEHAGDQIEFTTGADGYVTVGLSNETDGLSIRKNTVYYLEMITAPYEILYGEHVYYQRDNTYYSFVITDEPSYNYGNVYSYFNEDVLKVRCYPEAKGVNITKRFSGNYTLTDEQKNAITFVLQKEALGTAEGWVEVERHTYGEFSYGSMNFNTGREGGTELEDFATYRVIEENALPDELAGKIEENVSVTVSYQREGLPVIESSNEFFVDPDDKLAFSYDYSFTNEYVDHKLTVIKINEHTGAVLQGAVFGVYTADGTEMAGVTYTTGADGSFTIHRADEGANYVADTLYYVVETAAPAGYILPASPEKIYFYFSENGSGVPVGLPAGSTATDLATSYNTVTLSNNSAEVSVPVTVVWGVNGNEAWPQNVGRVLVGLYRSVGGAAAEKVLDNGHPRTLELSKDHYYDTATFVNLPAQADGTDVVYSVVEEAVYDSNGTDITSQFARSSSISGTNWHVVKNEPGVSVTVTKQWLDQSGNPVSDTTDKPAVTFDLYRTTTESEALSFTREELETFLGAAEHVQSGLMIPAGSWSITLESLQKTDRQGNLYYYYALEDVPDNQEDSYAVAAATDTQMRTLTITNKQTPVTVNIAVSDSEKTYGDADPIYVFDGSTVKEDGATITISGPDGSGNHTATVTAANGSVSTITFTVSRDPGENAGVYVVTPSGAALQAGYRVLFETGTLTINRAEVTVTAGAAKVYGEEDPALVSVEGLIGDDTVAYTVSREEGEDAGDYPITLTGEVDQGNYRVTYDRSNAVLTITRAPAIVTANVDSKQYGEDDPELTATVTGLRRGDEASVLNYELIRETGEDVGTYTITAAGDPEQGNYLVTYVSAEFTITAAALIVKVVDAEKTYGDEDPEWEVEIDGLYRDEEGGTLTSELNEETGERSYSYTISEADEAAELLTFTVTREAGESVGSYTVTPEGEQIQGNYTITFETGTLSIERAELFVTADHVVKAIGVETDPLLTASVTGWKNGDDPLDDTTLISTDTGVDGAVTRTYKRGTGENETVFEVISSIAADKTVTWTYKRGEVTLLTFTLKRDPGEDEGEYQTAVSGGQNQSNYSVEYEQGSFGILSILDVDVKQPVIDYTDANAAPSYTYVAKLDLTETGLAEYEKNGFTRVDGVPTLSFTLPDENKADMMTLKVPGGAKLTVEQKSESDDYVTAISLDGNSYTNPNNTSLCTVEHVDTYHEIAFTHSRISLPVEARASESQSEADATKLEGRKGAMGIPTGEDLTRTIDGDFADDMHSRIEYVLPADKYYAYDHASLYTEAGDAIAGGTNVTQIKYDRDNAKWLYRTNGDFVEVPENAQLVLFYLPKYVCKIGTEKFYSLRDAVEYADEHGKTATIEMLIGEYTIRSKDDAVTIPTDCTITITTATTEYEGTGTAVISRSLSYPNGHLFYNDGTLTFDTITLEGNSVQAGDALVLNRAENAALTVNQGATLQNAKGVNGGAIYQAGGTVTVNGTLTNNAVTNGGGAVYVKAGTFTMGADGKLIGNSAATGGAVHVNDGTVNIGGTIGGTGEGDGNTATSGGAVYINKGTVNVTGSVTGNGADNGGAVYQVGGTLTVSGSMNQNTASVNGGAAYVSNGTLTVEAGGSLSDNSATGNGGAVYQAGGTVDNEGVISGNGAASGGGIYRVNGALTVGGTLSGNTANENGGGLYTVGGAVTVTGTLGGDAEGAANSAANGGAIYTSGTTLNLNGARFTGNTATDNGGAIYALNADTVIGGTWTNAATEGTAASFKGNAATGNGGALYMEGGSVTVMNANSTLNANTAENGGAIYATSGAITVEKGKLESNEANANGGAIYADSASVTVKGGTLGGTAKGNKARQGDGGAIYSESGAVTMSGGTLAGNSAESGEGGAIYANSGTVTYTGGSINGGNSAINGAAIYVGSGIANVSASITGNTASNGGAIGVGGTSARLFFKGNAEVNNNTMNGAQSNVYLDVDSELVVNADSLNNGKKIGIYVPGVVDSDQVVKHGDVTGYFGAYVSAGTLANISNVFKSDRFSDLKVAYENNRVYWISNLTYDIYWLKNYDSQFPPTTSYTAAPSKKVCTNKTYAPRTRTSDIYDLVMDMKLYEKHSSDFVNNVGADYASTAVYAYTFSDEALNNTFANYLKTIRWDGTARKWMYDKQDGTPAPVNTARLIIFYSAPAYLTVVNNNTSGLELDISELTVLSKDAGEGVYGYVTAKNGATVTTLRTLTADDLKLGAGDSIKLMFPGAQEQKFTLKGTFTGEGAGEGTAVSYTFNGGARQTITGTTVDFSSDSFKLNPNDESADLIFGDALPICKIGDQPFSTLKEAMAYAVAQKASTGNDTYKIEMLVDYLVPKDDILEIPAGYNITFTTAAKDAETLPYKGNGTRATLSRDTGNTGSSVSATNSTLTVDSLAFDGRSLTASGAGGAVSAMNCTTVTITNCDFKGYRAKNGGAVYVDNQNTGSSLTVEDCSFYNCQTNASNDKAGGGGLWTTARELYVRRCDFDFCACLAGNAQAGSIFHNIRSGWAPNSKTVISDCTFSNSYSVGGSGGTIETDALDVTIENCEFRGSYTNKSKGNGGAINALAGDTGSSGTEGYIGNYNADCWLTVRNCLFEGCRADNSGNGGAIVSSMWYVTIEDCKFDNCQAKYGGAIKMTNTNAKWLHVNGCTFNNCTAAEVGGGVNAAVPSIEIKKSNAGKFLDNTDNDGATHFIDCVANRGGGIDNNKDGATVTMENVDFTRCAARTNSGGALYTKAQTLSITGDANTFTDCTGYGNGGAVYQLRNADKSSVTLDNCTFTGCEANNNGNGGGLYANARTLSVNFDTANGSAKEGAKGSFVNCTAANAGGGLYHDYAGTVNIANCGFEGCIAKAATGGGLYTIAQTLKIIGEDSKFKDCTAQTDGGGLYHNRNADGSSFTFRDGSFENCTATGNYGGAIYTPAKTVALERCTVKDSTAKAQGGGIWINPATKATFDDCAIIGNSVTNSDSKGGGVYVGGGTMFYNSGTVSGCGAAYGGGWYQNNGNLYILGGSISGSASVDGGGLYVNKTGNTDPNVYQYGGTVGGTATGNGGGVYKYAGNYTLGNGIYNNTEYTGGASIGGLITLTATENGTETTTHVLSSATNGGGIYHNSGTFTLKAGGSIGGVTTSEAGDTVYTATASANGGGIWNMATVNHNGGDVTGSAVNGGGVWQTDATNGKYTLSGGTVTGTASENGGAFYQGGNFLTINSGAVVGRKTATDGEGNEIVVVASSAKNGGGVYVAAGTTTLNAGGSIAGASASGNGGGVYQAGGTFNLNGGNNTEQTNDGVVADNTAVNGGGVYVSGGTFTFKRGKIVRNNATENGGGVYHAGGTFSMTTDNGATVCGVIGGSAEDANIANIGAGIFVADNQSASFNDWASKTMEISYNHALTAGGGIAVGGPGAVLTFQNAVKVRNNTMGAGNTECNVYLDLDSNTVIQNAYLNAASYIGVYVKDGQEEAHGQPGMPFGTYTGSNEQNLDVYHNDRTRYLSGSKGNNNLVKWSEFVCKITDGAGNLLYKDASGTPAVYAEVENRANSANNSAGAFTALNVAGTPSLYKKDAEGNYALYNEDGTGEYQVQMLVQNYEMGSTRQIKLNADASGRKITLTTASDVADECGFKYNGDPRFPATILRTGNTSSMVYVGDKNGWELTLCNITLDGGNKTASEGGALLRINNGNGKVTLDSGATLQNGSTNNLEGGAVYINNANASLTMNAGSHIKGCAAGTSNGGAVAINNGTFTMNGGTISGCTAKNGGGVWMNNASKFYMNGSTITGNSATDNGGGIALSTNNDGSRIYFSGYCTVTDNMQNGVLCNVRLNRDKNEIINAKGLDSRSEIGIYTPDRDIYKNHGESGDPFGTWSAENDNLFCFVNDRSREKEGKDLRGFQSANTSDKKIYWEYHPLLTVAKEVSSDLNDDQNTVFTFTVKLPDKTSMSQSERNSVTGMVFSTQGEATVNLKAGESATAVFPDNFDHQRYEVTEVLSSDQTEDYTVEAEWNGEAYSFTEERTLTVSGQLGENVGTDNSTSLSEVVFTNTRATGKLTISKQVDSKVEGDKAESFDFNVTLADTGISKEYEIAKKDSENNETEGTLSFTEGVSESFTLKHGESLTVKGLPTDLEYTVEEKLTDAQRAHIRTQVSKDGSEAVYAVKQDGMIGENTETETVEGVEKTVYASKVAFTNSFLEIVCKITNRSRALLYYRDAAGNLQPAIFAHLEDAFDQINSGNLRTSTNGTVSGALRIEMVVPTYTMEKTAVLNSGKTVTLSTALTTDEDYPYNKGEDDGINTATVYRGFEEGSMIEDSGALTIDKIVLDGGNTPSEQLTAIANGGIIKVAGAVRLTVNSNAILQNSATSGNGGAICLGSGASIVMNGTISNCSGASGGGIYADTGFTTITTTGTITGCEATTGNGGAIYASTGRSVNLNAGTALTGNTAGGNGGAVYTEANLILRGSVGGTETDEGNTANGSGGGIYMGEGTTFTMYAGSSISGNRAANGGGLATMATARIAGGTLQGNIAQVTVTGEGDEQTSTGGQGGAVYAAKSANVTISGAPVIKDNMAKQGGAVYNDGSVTVTGGAMTGNVAYEKGGAVYVAEDKIFTMSGGSIKDGNKSPEGAVSTGAGAKLAFSGNAVVSGNTDSDDTTVKNVYLGYDSNAIITTSGLGSSANIGIYVADGEPEASDPTDPNYREDHVNNPIYADHGVGGRDFGTYTGSNLSGARLNKFVNDRDTSLTGMTGTLSGEIQYIAWIGKGLELKVTQYLIQTDADGNPVLDEDGIPVLSDEVVPVQNASFTFAIVEGEDEVQVWSGKSSTEGIVTIPWGGSETADGNVASFVPGSVYRLDQTAAAGNAVLPAGHWKVTIGRDNSVIWKVVPVEGEVDRTLSIALPENKKPFLGETFGLKNDIKPTVTYDVNDGNSTAKLADNTKTKTENVPFNTTDISRNYTITESNPTWDSHVFRAWATMEEKPESENNTALTEEELKAAGYFEYERQDEIMFFRGTDSNDPKEKYTTVTDPESGAVTNVSKGDMTLYAQWNDVVCKITDRNGVLLYINGSPAVYGTLEAGFEAYNNAGPYDFTFSNGRRATARWIEMLVSSYELNEGVELSRGKTVGLTTAPTTDTDGYAYTGKEGTVCVITRGGSCDESMITNKSNLTLKNITLDGGSRSITCDGGIVNNAQSSAVLTVTAGATLHNSIVNGKGGAVMLVTGTKMSMEGGSIVNNTAADPNDTSANGYGGAVYVAPAAEMTMTGGTISGNASRGIGGGVYLAYTDQYNYGVLRLSGNPNFGGTDGGNYQIDQSGKAEARQDIALTGLGDTSSEVSALESLVIAGTINNERGPIWVWAEGDYEEVNHYKVTRQFAVLRANNIPETTLQVFRNARPDSDTENNTGEFLYGTSEGDVPGYVYWNGVKGSRRVILRKVDSTYTPIKGREFTVYKGTGTSPYVVKDKVNNTSETLDHLPSLDSGVFWIGNLPYGWYIIQEGETGPYFYLIVTESEIYGTLEDGKDKVGGYSDRETAEDEATANYEQLKQ